MIRVQVFIFVLMTATFLYGDDTPKPIPNTSDQGATVSEAKLADFRRELLIIQNVKKIKNKTERIAHLFDSVAEGEFESINFDLYARLEDLYKANCVEEDQFCRSIFLLSKKICSRKQRHANKSVLIDYFDHRVKTVKNDQDFKFMWDVLLDCNIDEEVATDVAGVLVNHKVASPIPGGPYLESLKNIKEIGPRHFVLLEYLFNLELFAEPMILKSIVTAQELGEKFLTKWILEKKPLVSFVLVDQLLNANSLIGYKGKTVNLVENIKNKYPDFFSSNKKSFASYYCESKRESYRMADCLNLLKSLGEGESSNTYQYWAAADDYLQGNVVKSKQRLETLLKQTTDFPKNIIYFDLIANLLAENKVSEVEVIFNKLVELNKNETSLSFKFPFHLHRANFFRKKKQYQKAWDEISQGLEVLNKYFAGRVSMSIFIHYQALQVAVDEKNPTKIKSEMMHLKLSLIKGADNPAYLKIIEAFDAIEKGSAVGKQASEVSQMVGANNPDFKEMISYLNLASKNVKK